MFKRSLAVACLACATVAVADPQRARLTHENKFPELHQVEAGALLDYTEFDNRDQRSIGAYGRYGLLENFTVNAFLPWLKVDPDLGDDSESGLGDFEIGVELKAWEDIFEYPYVIPHAELTFPTGDEDEGLGAGDSITTFGISVGTVTFDQLHWVADVSYAINGGREQPDPDNIFIIAASIIWDVSDRFAVLFEGNFTDEDNQADETPALYQGGFSYDWTDSLMTAFYFGAGAGGDENEEGIASAKVAYTF